MLNNTVVAPVRRLGAKEISSCCHYKKQQQTLLVFVFTTYSVCPTLALPTLALPALALPALALPALALPALALPALALPALCTTACAGEVRSNIHVQYIPYKVLLARHLKQDKNISILYLNTGNGDISSVTRKGETLAGQALAQALEELISLQSWHPLVLLDDEEDDHTHHNERGDYNGRYHTSTQTTTTLRTCNNQNERTELRPPLLLGPATTRMKELNSEPQNLRTSKPQNLKTSEPQNL